MKYDDEIRPNLKLALKALGDSDRELEAQREVEARLQAAFRRKHRRNIWPAVWAIAATAIFGIAIGSYRSSHVQPVAVANVQKPTVSIQDPPSVSTAVIQPVQVAVSRPKTTRVRPAQPREIMTDFFPLVDYAPPSDDAELVRVSLPAGAMREVGLPVREDRMMERVQADVVVRNGLATAIRFVRNSE